MRVSPTSTVIFDGNTQDRASSPSMLDALEARVGGFRRGQMVVVDRGMAFEENLEQLRARVSWGGTQEAAGGSARGARCQRPLGKRVTTSAD